MIFDVKEISLWVLSTLLSFLFCVMNIFRSEVSIWGFAKIIFRIKDSDSLYGFEFVILALFDEIIDVF